ncbi:hypothetical protein [Actinomadura sp. 9N407]|uniref:hypothetical protein n=1 Tax=Actinomadura sp. 9N407 TaxID=3375154 RepID=UPI0037884376
MPLALPAGVIVQGSGLAIAGLFAVVVQTTVAYTASRTCGDGGASTWPWRSSPPSSRCSPSRCCRRTPFYSLGSALGAAATTALYDAAGWIGPTVLGATLALCALATWARTGTAARPPRTCRRCWYGEERNGSGGSGAALAMMA